MRRRNVASRNRHRRLLLESLEARTMLYSAWLVESQPGGSEGGIQLSFKVARGVPTWPGHSATIHYEIQTGGENHPADLSDHTLTNGSVTLTGMDPEETVSFNTVDDTHNEFDFYETFKVVITQVDSAESYTFSTDPQSFYIADNETPPPAPKPYYPTCRTCSGLEGDSAAGRASGNAGNGGNRRRTNVPNQTPGTIGPSAGGGQGILAGDQELANPRRVPGGSVNGIIAGDQELANPRPRPRGQVSTGRGILAGDPLPSGEEFTSGPVVFSSHPVRYSDGVVLVSATDLASAAGGIPWGITRNWTNGPGYLQRNIFGSGMVITEQPQLVQVGGTSDTLALVTSGHAAQYFDLVSGIYVPRGFVQDKLVETGGEFIFTNSAGVELRFHDFANGKYGHQRGQIKSLKDASGNTLTFTYNTDFGLVAEVQRATTVGSTTITESFLYSYVASGANVALVSSVVLRRKENAGAWVTTRQVEYEYYEDSDSFGSNGDLKLVTIKDGSSNVLDTTYYRYYESSTSTGYQHGLKYVVYPESYRRLTAAEGTNLDAIADVDVATYADHYFEYDSEKRATKEIAQGAGCSTCSGGQGSFTYSYTTSSNSDGYNSWKVKTVETLPDGNQTIVYTNYVGQVMLHVYKDTTTSQEWKSYVRYDSAGRVLFRADPSAVSGYSDSFADLVDYDVGTDDFAYIRDTEGLITSFTYYATTTASTSTPGGVAGYLEEVSVREGEDGTDIPQQSQDYIAHTVSSQTIYLPASTTAYANTNGTGGLTTEYDYTFHTGAFQVESQTSTDPAGGVNVVFYDTHGRPTWQKDPGGFLHYAAYDQETGAVVKTITDVDHTETSDFTGLPSGWTTPTGGGLHLITSAEVDTLGRPTKATDANGNFTYYVYDDVDREIRMYPGWDTVSDAPTSPTIVVRADSSGSYSEVLTMSATPSLTGDIPNGSEAVSGLQTLSRSHVNAAGQAIHEDAYFSFDSLTYSTSSTLGTEGTHFYRTEQSYDNRGRLSRVERADGTIYRTVFDGQGRPLSEWIGDNDTPVSGNWSPTNPADMIKVREYEYDAGGIGDSHLTSLTDALGRETLLEYDVRGRLIETTLPDPDGVGSLIAPIYLTVYDNLGRITSETDPLSNVTTYAYDIPNRRVTVTLPDPDGAGSLTSPVFVTEHDARGLLFKQTDPLNNFTTYAYDGAGRNVKITQPDPDGVGSLIAPIWEFEYDAAGNLRIETDPLGNGTEYQYDKSNRLVKIIGEDPDGGGSLTAPEIDYAYDAAGFLLSVSDPLHRATSYAYDRLGRTLTQTDPDPDAGGSLLAPVTEYAYDAASRLISVTDPLDNVTEYDYDFFDRRTSITQEDPDGAGSLTEPVTTFTYDNVGNLLTLTDPVGNETSWEYDNLNRVIEETNELLKVRTFKYDAASNLIERVDRLGRKIVWEYDNLHRNTFEKWYDGVNLVRTLEFDYDTASRMTEATDPAATYGFTYDNLGRVTDESQSFAGFSPLLAYSRDFNAASRVTSLAASIGGTADFENTHAYDNLNRLTRLEQADQASGNAVAEKRVDFAYNAAGQFEKISRYADVAGTEFVANTFYSYDGIGRLLKLLHSTDATAPGSGWGTNPLAGYLYAYDAGSRITSIDSYVDGLATYTHDNTDQLTGADHTSQTDESYTYDENGNRTMTGYATGDNNQLTSDGTYNYTYDDEGNRLTRTKISSGEKEEYTWDHRNRLTKVTVKNSGGTVTKTIDHTYNVSNRWIRRSVDSDGPGGAAATDTFFSWLDDQIALEFDGTAAADLSHRYLWNPAVIDQILADESVSSLASPGDVLYPLTDHLGTPRDIAQYDDGLNETTIVNHRVFDSYGKLISETNSSFAIAIGFTGVYFDIHTGLGYHRNRWYDVRTGRWISEDPKGFGAGDSNLRRYVANAPLGRIDPLGLHEKVPVPLDPPPLPRPYPTSGSPREEVDRWLKQAREEYMCWANLYRAEYGHWPLSDPRSRFDPWRHRPIKHEVIYEMNPTTGERFLNMSSGERVIFCWQQFNAIGGATAKTVNYKLSPPVYKGGR